MNLINSITFPTIPFPYSGGHEEYCSISAGAVFNTIFQIFCHSNELIIIIMNNNNNLTKIGSKTNSGVGSDPIYQDALSFITGAQKNGYLENSCCNHMQMSYHST